MSIEKSRNVTRTIVGLVLALISVKTLQVAAVLVSACYPAYRARALGERAVENEVDLHFKIVGKTIEVTGVVSDRGFLAEGSDLETRFDGPDGELAAIVRGVKGATPYVVLDDGGDGAPLICVFDLRAKVYRAGAAQANVGEEMRLRGSVASVHRKAILMKGCSVPPREQRF